MVHDVRDDDLPTAHLLGLRGLRGSRARLHSEDRGKDLYCKDHNLGREDQGPSGLGVVGDPDFEDRDIEDLPQDQENARLERGSLGRLRPQANSGSEIF